MIFNETMLWRSFQLWISGLPALAYLKIVLGHIFWRIASDQTQGDDFLGRKIWSEATKKQQEVGKSADLSVITSMTMVMTPWVACLPAQAYLNYVLRHIPE